MLNYKLFYEGNEGYFWYNFLFQICPSSPVQVNYTVTEHEGIKQWLKNFVSAKRLSGFICFDFIVDKNTKEAYCIECNPRLHSAIVSFNTNSQVSLIILRWKLRRKPFVSFVEAVLSSKLGISKSRIRYFLFWKIAVLRS